MILLTSSKVCVVNEKIRLLVAVSMNLLVRVQAGEKRKGKHVASGVFDVVVYSSNGCFISYWTKSGLIVSFRGS